MMHEFMEKMWTKRKTCKLLTITLLCLFAVTCYYGVSAWYEVHYGSLKKHNILSDYWDSLDKYRWSRTRVSAAARRVSDERVTMAATADVLPEQLAREQHNEEEVLPGTGRREKGNSSLGKEHGGGQERNISPVVPNIVHFVWMPKSKRSLQFTEMVSILSAFKVQKPKTIYFHCSFKPFGRWWDELSQKFSVSLEIRGIMLPLKLENQTVDNFRLAKEFIKLDVLKHYGGIVMELDVVIINRLDELRIHQFCIGKTTSNLLSSSLILSAENSSFVKTLYQSAGNLFSEKPSDSFDVLSTAARISSRNPDMMHVETESLTYPEHKHLLYTDNPHTVNWRKYYVICFRFQSGENKIYTPEYIKNLTNLIGQVLRFIYYGSADRIDPFLPHVWYSVPISPKT